MRTQPIVPALGLLALSYLVAGCSGSNKPSQVEGNGTGDPVIVGGENGGGLNVGPNGTGAGSGIPVDGGVVQPDAACAQSSSSASLGQLTMLVMMDDSGSMNENNKWNQVAAAMKAFFADPAAAGLHVGLRLFPSDTPTMGCTKSVCDTRTTGQATAITACSTPLVEIAELTAAAAPTDTQEAKLLAAIPANPRPARDDAAGTPTYAALQGAENIATEYAAAHPGEKVVVVFVTDGEPNGCDERIADIAKIASDTLAAKKIETYAIGILGSKEDTINRIAEAGGTTKGIIIGGSDGATTEKDLLAAFGNIKSANVSCNFPVPPAPANLMLDKDHVNVNYTPGKGKAVTLPRVEKAASCGTTGGWYYDDNATPTQILLCGNTCMTVQADTGAALQVLYSCVGSEGYNPPK
ncbi:MAG: vWA domain-containing protein [Pseudomonadota bacterium]